MKLLLLGLVTLCFAGCGYSSMDNEMIGQVKKVVKQTPIFCSYRDDVDVSMGVMRNGVGSMSSQDVWLTIGDSESLKILKAAADSGELVKIHYDVARITFCWEDHIIRKVELVK